MESRMARKNYGKIKSRDTFYIITNGEKTEKNYFELLKKYKSIYEVKVVFHNSDPFGLVTFACNKAEDANQVWCVFDIDSSYEEGRLIAAIKHAEKNGIKYAFSNRAFEVWLISHYKKCENYMDCQAHQKELDKYLMLKAKQKYIKGDEKQLATYFVPCYKNAVQNAKIVHQKWVRDHLTECGSKSKYRIWDWNSCTTVYKLVEALKLQIVDDSD